MTTILYIGAQGPDHPTEATLPFHLAIGAVEMGYRAQIALVGDATTLIHPQTAEQVRGVGVPPLMELMQKIVEHEVPIMI